MDYCNSTQTPKMENFPSLTKAVVPTKLTPFVEDHASTQYPPVRLSRAVLSLFESPSGDAEMLNRSEFVVPRCYHRSHLTGESEMKLKPSQVKQFSIDTLFYCFHYLPSDVLQVVAAQELVHRGWKYHSEMKQWFRPAGAEDGVPPGQKTLVYFDPIQWARRVVPGPLDHAKFLAPSDYTTQVGALNLASLKSGPPRRFAAPFSPQSVVMSQPPVTPSGGIR